MLENDTCRSFTHDNLTQIGNVYEGIPETFLLNLATWVLLLLLFAVLRNRAWDYGRLALVQNERWTQLFYKSSSTSQACQESSREALLDTDVGCRWIPTIFMINKQKIFARCGPDALHYLSFQQHLLGLMGIIMIISICVILPINFQGNLQGNVNTFGHTTISNLESTSNWLWVHIVTALVFVPLTILIMRRCSSHIPSSTLVSSRTIMITNISHAHRNTEDIKNYLSYCFPNLIDIKDIQLAYRIKQLMHVEEQRMAAQDCLMYCVGNKAANVKVRKNGCIVCCRCNLEDAELYYSELENELNALVREERHVAIERPLGICFVTFETEEQAKYVVEQFVPGTLRKWSIWRAPSPSDINWENLQISMRYWYSKAIIINCLLFIVFFFLTTPAVVVSTFDFISTKDYINKITPIFSEFLPTLILLTMSALMPVIVAYSDQWMSHWTKSKQNLATMNKTFIFLLFMVLILPSLGLTSAQAFVEWSIQNKNKTMRWECIFLSDKGAFFVNYVITSALIGTGLELLRFPELAMYVWRVLWMKSKAEVITIRKQILAVFPFGIHYSWTLLIFTISTAYSLICPLITPFGFLYLCLKHLVDKHNIYYVYKPITMSEEGHQIHSSAVRLVRVGVMLLQTTMAAFATIRGGFSLMAIITILGLFGSLGFFFMLSPFPSCRPKQRSNSHDVPTDADSYIAPVLVTSDQISPISVISNQNGYGSSTVTDDEIVLSRPGSSMA
ncbi:calcium permeable stress-gated cation channel 1 [Onthophagus taurus]|uniref:calcium permeable stress-gated cation channel 1 n=1 Tax=Onthophagus taurus TaxID=166361 RepID=UPI000C206BEE|nr:CSC1-like protein 1 [Onthophagus taurus]XP_022915184.1 CSC1-like protein 1 [Onthophagus taurus]